MSWQTSEEAFHRVGIKISTWPSWVACGARVIYEAQVGLPLVVLAAAGSRVQVHMQFPSVWQDRTGSLAGCLKTAEL